MPRHYDDPWNPDTNEPIREFKDEYFFLSNFSISRIRIQYKGKEYIMDTGEHCFQGMKVAASVMSQEETIRWLEKMSLAPTPSKSKYLGRSIRIDVPKWDAMAYACMVRTQKLKYEQNPDLADKLRATGNRELIEGTKWGDKLWGVDEKGEGQNLLGKILMDLRSELQRQYA